MSLIELPLVSVWNFELLMESLMGWYRREGMGWDRMGMGMGTQEMIP